MTETLFSSFLMIDRPVAPVAGRRTPSVSGGQPARESEEKVHELFARAFLRALEEAAPAIEAEGSPALAGMAAAAADVVLGRSVVLQLKPGLAEGQRSAVRSFLETIV